MVTRREHVIRAGFSFLAAAVQLYMAAEHVEAFLKTRRPETLGVAVATTGLAVMEAWKVGVRVERLLGLRI